MRKKILSEIDLVHGEIESPKGFEIDRDQIRNDIIDSFVNKKRINLNPKAYSYDDYVVPFSKPLQWLQDYVRDHFKCEYDKTLITNNILGNVMHPKEKSWIRNQVDPVDLLHAPDYTLIYGVDVKEGSSECIIEYDDNRRKNRTWHMPLKNNKFLIFPATNKYSFSPNTSDGLNIILTINYEYI
jgi:hypothetical protein